MLIESLLYLACLLAGFAGGWYVRRRYAVQVSARLAFAEEVLAKAGINLKS
jgi:hypothetical protein